VADCVFCGIVAKEIPSSIVYEDDDVVAFEDRHPAAPMHVLVIPRRHIAKLADLDDEALGGKLIQAVRAVARRKGHADNFRVVANNGDHAGQSVWHLHLHVLGGRQFTWPPG
jgi:histidine triad (HIT) family protein